MLVHVVEASAEDPVFDYRTVKEELRMYNPDYLERSSIVVLNKIDVPEAKDRLPFLVQEIMKIGHDNTVQSLSCGREHEDAPEKKSKIKEIEVYPPPVAVAGASVLKCINISEMVQEIRATLRKCREPNEALRLSLTR